jgi:hypothetical protein
MRFLVRARCLQAVMVCVLLLISGCGTLKGLSIGGGSLRVESIHEQVITGKPEASSRIFANLRAIDPNGFVVTGQGIQPYVTYDGGLNWEPFEGERPPTMRYFYTIKGEERSFHFGFRYLQRSGDTLRGMQAAWSQDGVIVEEIDDMQMTIPGLHPEPVAHGYASLFGGYMDPDGTLYIFAQVTMEEDIGAVTARSALGRYHRRSILLRSNDQGRSFSHHATVATSKDAPWANEGPNESGFVILPSGEILSIMRTGSDRAHAARAYPMLSARSSDWGTTWHSHSRIPRRGVRPRVIQLQNGILVCTAGRPDNNLIFSVDEGGTWTREYNLDSRHRSSGYMSLAEVEPNRILVIYELQDYRTKRFWLWEPPPAQSVVKAVVLEVRAP